MQQHRNPLETHEQNQHNAVIASIALAVFLLLCIVSLVGVYTGIIGT